jgi:hypothetical protein
VSKLVSGNNLSELMVNGELKPAVKKGIGIYAEKVMTNVEVGDLCITEQGAGPSVNPGTGPVVATSPYVESDHNLADLTSNEEARRAFGIYTRKRGSDTVDISKMPTGAILIEYE